MSSEYTYYLVVGDGPVAQAIDKIEEAQQELSETVERLRDMYGVASLVHNEFGSVLGVTLGDRADFEQWVRDEGRGETAVYRPNEELETGKALLEAIPDRVPTAFDFSRESGIKVLMVKNEMGTFIRQPGYRIYHGLKVVFRPVDIDGTAAEMRDESGLKLLTRDEYLLVSIGEYPPLAGGVGNNDV